MSKMTIEAQAARLDVLGVALQEIARALAPAQAAQVAEAIRLRVAALAAESMKPSVDEALTAELAPLLLSLQPPRVGTATPATPGTCENSFRSRCGGTRTCV